jgi:hypothetical protein
MNYNVPDLSMLYAQRKKEILFGYDITDLLPTEITQLKELSVWAQRKLADHYPTVASLNQYALDVDAKFAENGWSIFVDPFNVELDERDNPVITPIFMLTGRTQEKDFDYDKAKGEVQSGLLDGVAGKIDEKGNWHEPDATI